MAFVSFHLALKNFCPAPGIFIRNWNDFTKYWEFPPGIEKTLPGIEKRLSGLRKLLSGLCELLSWL
jgi:hypothetical protein